MATKTEVFNTIVESMNDVFETNKVSKKVQELLLTIVETNLKPKKGGGVSTNPPKEIDGVMNYYCRFHQKYEPVQDIVMSQEKSKGYCKASISLWNKTNSRIKKLDSQAVELMTSGDFDKAQEIAIQAKELKDSYNTPEFYDYDRDWSEFTK